MHKFVAIHLKAISGMAKLAKASQNANQATQSLTDVGRRRKDSSNGDESEGDTYPKDMEAFENWRGKGALGNLLRPCDSENEDIIETAQPSPCRSAGTEILVSQSENYESADRYRHWIRYRYVLSASDTGPFHQRFFSYW